ncbi:hypothetical protein [Candidatus Thiothrix anitrata]|uniref:AAA-ATPase-like domain-containing protein n=1 Tax=Candidatus Thiothrix anitrata TaxID=2823902 RepID=A0ABX7X1A4_9GAMM|nr:hypothetical protein [Candidatus Thiothrix anitrata]QTR49702.1 hypothetical protein J8380_15935 [Candidatus Thiothrix anitrata]
MIKRNAADFPVVSITEPRQSGKTILAQHWFPLVGFITADVLMYPLKPIRYCLKAVLRHY